MSRTVTPKQMPKMAPPKGKPTTKKSAGKPKDKSKTKSSGGGGSSNSSSSSSSNVSAVNAVDTLSAETREETALGFPLAKTSDTSRSLPRYHAVLSRTEEEGVVMDDLDQLQLELESLLSKVAVRLRLLQGEISAINSSETHSDKNKMGSPGKKNKCRGSKLVESLSKTRDIARSSNTKHSKKMYRMAPLAGSVPVVPPDNEPKPPAPKVFVSKNSAPNRFWASVDPYCTEVTPEHIKMLEDLIHQNETSLHTLMEIPPIGDHYSMSWALQELMDAQDTASMNRQRRKHAALPSSQEAANMLKKSSRFSYERASASTGPGPGPFANRLLAALIQENPVAPLHESTESNKVKVKSENEDDDSPSAKRIKLESNTDKALKERVRSTPPKAPGGENVVPYKPHVIACFERSLRLQLEAQGLLDPPETKKEEEEDGVLAELRRCQEELKTLSQENERQLRAMVQLLRDETVRQDLRRKLKLQDNEVLETYRKILAAKQERKPLSKRERDAAWKAVRDREAIVKHLDSLERTW